LANRSSKKRESAPNDREPRPAAHTGVIDVLGAARVPMSKLYDELATTERGLQKRCALVVDWGDPIGRLFYERGLGGAMPPTSADVMTFEAPFDDVMEVAAEFYRTANHVEPPMRAGVLRAVVLALGTVTVVHLERDNTPVEWNPVHASDSYLAKRGDVLLVAVAAWRSDQADGLRLHAVLRTRADGDFFLSEVERQMVAIGRASPTQAAIEAGLRRVTTPVELTARVFALVRWLRSLGLLPSDERRNGAELVFGSELELQGASELARELGGRRDDPN
jgi:hypothetical protein